MSEPFDFEQLQRVAVQLKANDLMPEFDPGFAQDMIGELLDEDPLATIGRTVDAILVVLRGEEAEDARLMVLRLMAFLGVLSDGLFEAHSNRAGVR